ncbi:MAG: UDP-N-acetylglucosamine 2-epimerase (non-hydrolyzing) [bacterium]|nr:UDP-N-acetylglucosamine 2-epimerase (non-hydrolyzing) [bacterium]
MHRLKVMVIIGTRPEAIKLVSVIEELNQNTKYFKPIVVTTAQHRELVDTVFKLFNIKPQFDCNIMQSKQTLTHITTLAVKKLTRIMDIVNPDIVLVQGDTTTAFSGALTAFYHRIPIGHIEAGLRSFHKYNPFPEEMNRILIGKLADWHFAPTELAKQYLINEGVNPEKIYITGNTGIDAVLKFAKQSIRPTIPEIKTINWQRRIILVEMHRRENWGKPLQNVCTGLIEIAKRNKDVEIVFPYHLNPVVQKTVDKILAREERIHLFKATNYADFIWLLNQSYLILTDSGGIQEEAPILGKPVLLLREVTERPEAVKAGIVKVIGTETEKVITETQHLLDDKATYRTMAQKIPLYGDGKAGKRIIHIILNQFGYRKSLPREFQQPII